MDVVIVRHAIAEERDAERWPDDRVRPLTPRGQRRFRQAARGLGSLLPAVDALISSSYVRAWETARLLTEQARWPAAERAMALEATGSPGFVLDLLRAHTEAQTVALVGHEPYLGELIAYLLTGDPRGASFALRKGSATLLRFADEPRPGGATLLWLLQPRALRSLAR